MQKGKRGSDGAQKTSEQPKQCAVDHHKKKRGHFATASAKHQEPKVEAPKSKSKGQRNQAKKAHAQSWTAPVPEANQTSAQNR